MKTEQDVQNMIDDIINYSDGQREFYFPEEFENFSEEQQVEIQKQVWEALDWCDHCGHLVDAPELSMDETGSRLCDMCFSQQEEERELEDDY